MKNRWLAWSCLGVASLVSSCVVHHHWRAREVSGLVVDSVTGEALADVDIYRKIGSSVGLVSKSSADGRFHVAAEGTVFVYLPLGGDPGHNSKLLFRKEGFTDTTLSVGTVTGDVLQREPPLLADVRVEMKIEPNQALEPTAPSGRGSP